jgi:hypothetical protein
MKTRSQLLNEQHTLMLHLVNMYLGALKDEELAMEVIPGRNHGVWLLGHLIAEDDDLSLYINKQPPLFPEYQTLFGQSSVCKPVGECPPASQLRREWEEVCEKNTKLYATLTDEMLDEPHEMIQGKIEDDFFRTKERVLTEWQFHQVYVAGQLGLLLGKAGRRLI